MREDNILEKIDKDIMNICIELQNRRLCTYSTRLGNLPARNRTRKGAYHAKGRMMIVYENLKYNFTFWDPERWVLILMLRLH